MFVFFLSSSSTAQAKSKLQKQICKLFILIETAASLINWLVSIKKINSNICLCSFDLSSPNLEKKDNFIESLYIVLYSFY